MIDGIWELRQRLPNVVMVEVLVTTTCPYKIDSPWPLCGANVLLVYAMVSVCVEVLAIYSTLVQRANAFCLFTAKPWHTHILLYVHIDTHTERFRERMALLSALN